MEDALVQDISSNKAKKPAFKRFAMLAKIESTLRKTQMWQEQFLLNDGV
jgi:hypothetical protein